MTKAKLYSEIQSGLIHVASGDLSVEKCREVIESMIDQYALQIAEKAVGEELEDNQYGDHQLSAIQESTCNRILYRIKTEIGGE